MDSSRGVLTHRQRLAWRIVQGVVFAIGAGIVLALFLRPRLGLAALWNVLVPVAPGLLVVAPGLWRNICPLGSVALLPSHMGWSARRRLSVPMQGWLTLTGLLLLLTIVPLRHAALNTDGPLTGSILVGVGLLAAAMGIAFEWKSGWCSGICPVHPVERLYGARPALSLPNAHCTRCHRCSAVCPDSTPEMTPLISPPTPAYAIAGTVLVGGFPGYVWGWFQVSDGVGAGPEGLLEAYAWPFAGLAASLALYLIVRSVTPTDRRGLLARGFAAAAVSCYYWFRLPMLLGLGAYPGEGVLLDLSRVLPGWTPLVLRSSAVAFFVWWLLLRPGRRRAWTIRPPFATGLRLGVERGATGLTSA